MNKKNLFARLALFFIGIPIIVCILWIPYLNHVGLHCLTLFGSAMGTYEMYKMLSNKYQLTNKWFLIVLGTLIGGTANIYSILKYFNVHTTFGAEIVTYVFIFASFLIFLVEVFTSKEFEKSIEKTGLSIFALFYAPYLLSFLTKLTYFTLDEVSVSFKIIVTFVLLVFGTDSFAWLFGMLFGKNNRGIVKASPNKSLIGFIGGYLGAIGIGVACYYIFNDVFTGSIVKLIVISVVIATSSIVGDLTESVIKRATNVKDSGHVIPGRGGLLDSIDSILMSAPIFYILISLMYNFN